MNLIFEAVDARVADEVREFCRRQCLDESGTEYLLTPRVSLHDGGTSFALLGGAPLPTLRARLRLASVDQFVQMLAVFDRKVAAEMKRAAGN
jgi:hypothetical protein